MGFFANVDELAVSIEIDINCSLTARSRTSGACASFQTLPVLQVVRGILPIHCSAQPHRPELDQFIVLGHTGHWQQLALVPPLLQTPGGAVNDMPSEELFLL